MLGYCLGTRFLIVNIIGVGIFVAPKGVLKDLHECGALPIGITFPCSGAHYYFLKRCFGNLISFLNLWTALFLGPGLAASQALLLAEYSIEPFFYPSCFVPKLPKKYLALAILWTVGILNSCGVKEVTCLQTASLVLKMAILGLISLSGVVLLVRGRKENVENFQDSFDTEFPEASQFIEAVFQGYFAFSGGGFIPCSTSASIFSNLLVNVFEYSRVTYMAGQEGQLPLLFNMLNLHSSPFVSVLVLVTMASMAIVSTTLIDLINYLYFVVSTWSVLSMIGILKLRYQEPNLPRPYKMSFPLPLVTTAIYLCLVLIPLVKSPHIHYIYMCLFVLNGLLYYRHLIYFKLRLIWFEKMTCYLQLLFNIYIPDVSEKQMPEVETLRK
ncbi:unnamed protein product [Nyctereutes procyonoides]|uniref:(raccoon dog) hypothetical protein n=1 Tax=Nyctereutes procyonoides TaxID=34880 RepID=A0A811ZI57_NYCPR|nr:unnamed protein product [Nyctereutes procyonoides]